MATEPKHFHPISSNPTASQTASLTMAGKRLRSSSISESESNKKQKTDSTDTPHSGVEIPPAETVPQLMPSQAPATSNSTDAHKNENIIDAERDEESNVVDDAATKTDRTRKSATAKKEARVPVKDLFTPWKPEIRVPSFNDAWGRKPHPGPDGPRPRRDSLPARTSNAATKVPMWEDRKSRFKQGSRFVTSPQSAENETEDSVDDFDQESMLVLPLIDMRPKSKKDPTPRRKPAYYVYEHGRPKNWNNQQTIKALNDRRCQAIDRITVDAPWTKQEREYLLELLEEFPDASITHLTEWINWRFMNKDFVCSTAFSWDHFQTGRTIESVRHEYLTFKSSYDKGELPRPRHRMDNSTEGKKVRDAERNHMWDVFGKPDRKLQEKHDNESSEEQGAQEHQEHQNHGNGRDNAKANCSPDTEVLGLADAFSGQDSPLSTPPQSPTFVQRPDLEEHDGEHDDEVIITSATTKTPTELDSEHQPSATRKIQIDEDYEDDDEVL